MITDTIAAIATANGAGGVGIVRLSGGGAVEIASAIFSGALTESHKMTLGKVMKDNRVIDEALGCFFKAPRSYT
ncbi:MAG: tRNA uridine-5-carboxymethylaminomethyl(34) synthesis GTPase MnmE, partial [Clostridiales bacterium]|nr:tRNA uridine-5-carboxymethylaminomethyl(34) synthesis GTPase MnmE [Clostridiales bacterium]